MKEYGRATAGGFDKHIIIPPDLGEKASCVQQAILVDRSRVERHDLPQYEGVIFSSVSREAKEALQRLQQNVYSVSQLESYGKCPYQFFAKRLLRLSPVEEMEEELTPLEKGSVLHEVLFEFYIERRERTLPPIAACTEDEFDEAVNRLVDITRQKLDSKDIPDAFWELDRELILGDGSPWRGLLREFLAHERKRTTTLQPLYFEVGFGSKLGENTRIDTTLSSEEPIAAGQVLLRGKVDRVEVDDDTFAVVDYKSGSQIPKLEEMRKGMSLQLPLYLYTIEYLLNNTRNPAGAAYYILRKPVGLKLGVGGRRSTDAFGVSEKHGNVLSDGELREVIDGAIAFVNRYVQGIAEGRFPLTSADRVDIVCTYCDFKKICRIQTVRHVTKSATEES